MADIYRDAAHAARERIKALERDIATLEGQLTPFIRAHLPEALCARLGLLTELPEERDPPRRADDLTAHLTALEEATTLLGPLRLELLELPSATELRLPTATPALASIYGESLDEQRDKLAVALRPLDEGVSIWVDGTLDYAALCATLHPEGEPVALIQTCLRRRMVQQHTGMSLIGTGVMQAGRSAETVEAIEPAASGQAWTGLAKGTPPLHAYPQKLRDTLLRKPLGLRRDATVGDKAIDRAFMFDAEEDVARTLIAGRVGKGLLRLHELVEDARLSIEESGAAMLTWEGELTAAVAEAVIDVLVGLRQTSIEPLLAARGLAQR